MSNVTKVVELKTKRFVIRKSLIGKNTIVTFTNKKQENVSYNHDEVYNTQVTDSYGNKYQNYFEHAHEANDWVYYIWSKEEWFNSVNSQELLYSAIEECKTARNMIVISMIILIIFIVVIENIK